MAIQPRVVLLLLWAAGCAELDRIDTVRDTPDQGVRSVPDLGFAEEDAAELPDAGFYPDAEVSLPDVGVDAGSCAEHERRCVGGERQECVAGAFVPQGSCTVVCVPGERVCRGAVAQRCASDGTELLEDDSSVGCDFWPVILGANLFGYFGGNMYAVTLTNVGTKTATISIEGGELTQPLRLSLPPNGVSVQPLSDRAPSIPFHVQASQPISVVEFNPLHSVVGGTHTYSCDSSLLRPSHTWGTRYVVASWPNFEEHAPGLLGVVALRDETTVTITPRAGTTVGMGPPRFVDGLPPIITLRAGEYLQLGSSVGDLTGAIIESTQPVQVIAGHTGAKIPATVDAADHLEEAILPVDQLSTEYFVVAPAVLTLPSGKAQVVRIIAAEPDVDLSYDPPQPGALSHIAAAGDFVELAPQATVYRVRGTKKIVVAQYMQSQDVGGGTGDPAMLVPLPPAQFEAEYRFFSPQDYESNYVDVVAPVGAEIWLDEALLGGFAPIGNTGYALARVLGLGPGPGGDGNHHLRGSQPFQASAYGYGQYTSYWHPL